MTRSCLCAAAMFGLLVLSSAGLAEPIAASSKVEAVTVYRGQALITRVVPLPEQAGELQIVVGDLPAEVIGPSLSASADGAEGVTVRSVSYQTRAAAVAPDKEVAELDEKIKDLKRQGYANDQMLKLLDAKAAYIDKLENFAAPTAQTEMSKGVLNPQTLTDVSDMIFGHRTKLTEERVNLHQKKEEFDEQLALLERKRNELARGAERTVREAVIFLTKAAKAQGEIRLNYLVGSANWSPAYNFRLADDGKTIVAEYLAQVQQRSGEDWKDVSLTLSTATPQMNAASPVLGPLWIGLVEEQAGSDESTIVNGKLSGKAYGDFQRSLRLQQASANTALIHQTKGGALDQAGWELNVLAARGQTAEINVEEETVRAGRETIQAVEEGLAVSYALGGKMSLASRPDQQLVQIAAMGLSGEAYYQAIPLLSNYVYLQARVVNTGNMPLLAGPYSAYVNGEFVGRGNLPLVARGQSCTVGFGVDTQLSCRRELVNKTDRVVWGSRVQTFDYQLRLENFKDHPVDVRLIGRIPASKTEDTKIKLGKTSDPLSSDEVYVRDLRPRGLLRWDVRLAAQAAGATARDVTYSYEMRFAKDKHVGRQAAGLKKAMASDYYMMLQH